ncbi:MAG: flagellar biosynthetic protein FliQ [Fuerstiella sp.]|nr:flagellar biosynthetic protein FliQ [Fuerstiella sp.]MCP4783559.1 flagellar biosynthetic protein FliQ [Fuerstiella sp.]MCP4857375.1 flagellar biosynthetic protein FliQ [Fuerstiella sp.]
MDVLEVVEIGRDLLITAMWLAGPPVFISLIVGLVVSIFQTITSVQEQTLSFAPRIVAVGVVLVVALPWMLTLTSSFTMRMVERMVLVTQ